MYVYRAGGGPKVLLIHGVGSDHLTWRLIVPALAAEREVWAVDLPGHGKTPAEADSGTFDGLVRSVTSFLEDEGLVGADMVGSSLGGRIVLELARRGLAGNVVALDPGGFWAGWERTFLQTSLLGSVGMLHLARPALPLLAHNMVPRTALLAQLSAQPWALDGNLVEHELECYVSTRTFVELVNEQAIAPAQEGDDGTSSGAITIGWGLHDRLCLPMQALRAQAAFPKARLHWFDNAGHYPAWDSPEETVTVIRETLAAPRNG